MHCKTLNYLCIFLLLAGIGLGSLNYFSQKADLYKKTELSKKSEASDEDEREDGFEDDSDDYLSICAELKWDNFSKTHLFYTGFFKYNFSLNGIQTPPPKIQD